MVMNTMTEPGKSGPRINPMGGYELRPRSDCSIANSHHVSYTMARTNYYSVLKRLPTYSSFGGQEFCKRSVEVTYV
jgi:hypothetical protein